MRPFCEVACQLFVLCGVLLNGAATVSAQTPSQIVSAGYSIPEPGFVGARGGVVTLFVKGLNVPDARAAIVPLPTVLSGVSVKVTSQIPGYPDTLPIFSIITYDSCAGNISTPCSLTHITVELPTEPTCVAMGFPNPCFNPNGNILLTVVVGGNAGQSFPVTVEGSQPHIVNACDTIFGQIGGICYSLVTHADGTFVGDAGYPNGRDARPGETITFYAVGLGATNPIVPTGQASVASAPATIPGNALPLVISYQLNLPAASPAPPVVWAPIGRWIYPAYVGLVPGYVGLYQVNVTLPEELAQAQATPSSDGGCPLTTRIAIGAGGDFGAADGGSYVDLCVQP